ncbi:MAG: methyltransferase domain-containing protein [Verrucomicrobia bacterium]|nr:MAG: methyltransferase domain-containing protein [Verrucomicrobiota bacterium]
MPATLRTMRALADPTRVRLLELTAEEELSVQELQEITGLGQSRISTHLRLLEEAGLVSHRREGKRSFYRLAPELAETDAALVKVTRAAARQLPEHRADQLNLRRVLREREDPAREYFNRLAGRFNRSYGPGRSWQAFAQMLLRMLPRIEVADLGCGEGLLSEMLARRCRRVIAVDNSRRMVAFGARKAARNGLANLEFRHGDLQDPPIDDASVDAVILSQALHHAEDPAKALRSAWRILRPGGQLLILDLRRHQVEAARTLYGDRWLGFAEGELLQWLEEAGFVRVEISVVGREAEPPHFETLLVVAEKPDDRGGPARRDQQRD